MTRMSRIATVLTAILLLGSSFGLDRARAESNSGTTQNAICLMLESAARENDLPIAFFARLIWQESSFNAEAVGPRTRSGAQAQGIAQFMPGTAAERSLLDPFDPVQALPKSAAFLRELRDRFGNLGLAAAAYNAGPRRVSEWLAGTGFMPAETRSYVLAITGRSVDDWVGGTSKDGPRDGPMDCQQMIAEAKRTPNTYLAALEERVGRAARKPWSVQLAAGFSRSLALSKYADAMNRFSNAIGERDPIVDGMILRSRGTRTFYQVSVGAETRSEADKVCAQIRTAGGACMVLRKS
jgi:Transglycosylase SLT domain/SPOR domain